MGESKRNKTLNDRLREERKRRKIRLFKGFIGLISAPFFLPWIIAWECYSNNKWPWDIG